MNYLQNRNFGAKNYQKILYKILNIYDAKYTKILEAQLLIVGKILEINLWLILD